MKNYIGNEGIRKLTELVLDELAKKQELMQEITAEEVQAIWEGTYQEADSE